jgi:uncharacterized protein YdeI (YjbR/CyaY-like superfamily)
MAASKTAAKKPSARKTIAARPGGSAAIDAYIANCAPFAQPILNDLRATVHKAVPEVEEAIKWSHAFFLLNGVILCNMAGFKAHCSFGLWGTEVTKDLRADGVAQGGSMGSFGRITSLDELPPRKQLIAYIQQAAKPIAEGTRTKAWSRPKVAKPEPEVPPALAAALKKDKAAAKRFETMSPSCRREYCDWIASAKQEATRDKRIATAVEWIAEGKQRNWKYETC